MVQVAGCPGVAQLERLLAGRLGDQEAEPLENHVLGCAACLAALKTMEGKETLTERAPAFSTAIQVQENPAAVAALIQQLKALRRNKGDGGDQGVSEEIRRLLAPAEATGELGRLASYRILEVLGAGGMGVV